MRCDAELHCIKEEYSVATLLLILVTHEESLCSARTMIFKLGWEQSITDGPKDLEMTDRRFSAVKGCIWGIGITFWVGIWYSVHDIHCSFASLLPVWFGQIGGDKQGNGSCGCGTPGAFDNGVLVRGIGTGECVGDAVGVAQSVEGR